MRKNQDLLIEYGSSLLGGSEIDRIKEVLKIVEPLEGDICEVGVYRGGTSKFISDNIENCDIFLFDTFQGMPYYDPNKDNKWEIGAFGETDYEKVCKLFEKKPNVKIFKGIFPSETSNNIIGKKFKFVHLDVDNYQSYKECLEFFYDKMTSGGIIIFDDYDHDCCPGANKAVDEFFIDKPENVQKNISSFIVKI
jgi:hypothetical protein